MDYRSTHPSSPHQSFAPPNRRHKHFVRNTLRVTRLIARLCAGNRNTLKTSNLRYSLSPMDGGLYSQSSQNKDFTDATILLLRAAAERAERSDFGGRDVTHLVARLYEENCKVIKTNNLPSHLSPMDRRLYKQSRQNKDFTDATILLSCKQRRG